MTERWTWDQIAERISMIEGKPICRQRCEAVGKRALTKLKNEILKDPIFITIVKDLGLKVDSE